MRDSHTRHMPRFDRSRARTLEVREWESGARLWTATRTDGTFCVERHVTSSPKDNLNLPERDVTFACR